MPKEWHPTNEEFELIDSAWMQVKVASEKRKEQSLLELEIDSQLEFIKYSRTQGCSDKVTFEYLRGYSSIRR